MVLLPISGDVGKKIMDANPGVFHATAFKKDSYKGVDADVPTIGITAVIHALDTFSEERVYQIVDAIFKNIGDLATVAKEVKDLTPEKSLAQLGPEAQKLLHPGAVKYFKEKGALK
jgi:hypothetical protein